MSCRFLSTDPLGGSIGELQSHNAYAYVVNNPMNLTDPSGLCQGGGPYSRPSACPDGDAPYPCTYAGAGFCGGGGGGLDGGCLLNGAPAACSMVNSLLSNPSGATLPCPPYCLSVGQRLVDGPNGSVLTQQWAPWYVYGHAIVDKYGNVVESDLSVVWHWATIATEPQIGMPGVFQFGAFTQAYSVVKAGTIYTAAGVGTVVAAPVAVEGYAEVGNVAWDLGATPEDVNATWDIIRSVISPMSTTPPTTVGGGVVRILMWLKMLSQ